MTAQIIEKNGRPEWAVIPYNEYLNLIEIQEDTVDTGTIEKTLRSLSDGTEELVPALMVNRILDGENPITVWREHRNYSIAKLAEVCSVTASAISQIEKRKRQPSIGLLRKIAAALKVGMDDLLDP
jgi:DNA-binding XRE family transcriptional regulator